jgi:hypothetical protein
LPDFSWYKIPNTEQMYQMTKNILYSHKIDQMAKTASIARPSKIYPNWDIWIENMPSGNPGRRVFGRHKKSFFEKSFSCWIPMVLLILPNTFYLVMTNGANFKDDHRMYVCMYVCMYIIRLGVTSLWRTSLITKCMYVHSNAYICTYAFWWPCVKAYELIQNRVARFFLVEHTKTAINIPNDHTIHTYTRWL